MTSRRNLVISISETFDSKSLYASGIDASFKGALPPMPTALSVNYVRKSEDGTEYSRPLNPVYLEVLVEALAYVSSLSVSAARQLPFLTEYLYMQYLTRAGTYARARFPEIMRVMREQCVKAEQFSPEILTERDAYMREYEQQLLYYDTWRDKKKKATARFRETLWRMRRK